MHYILLTAAMAKSRTADTAISSSHFNQAHSEFVTLSSNDISAVALAL